MKSATVLFGHIMVIVFILVGNVESLAQKDCNHHTTGLVPLTDLTGGKQYRGYQGGKYQGSNKRSALQMQRAIAQVSKIKPLDTAGVENFKNGRIVFAAVGASNPATEFESFRNYCDTFKNLNPKLSLINTCIGAMGVQKINDITDNYWVQAKKELIDSGLSNKQVQVVWLEEENTQNADTSFPGAPQALMLDYQKLLNVILKVFPNVKIVYMNQRAYAGYGDVTPGVIGKGLWFPRDYYNGWTIKWLIEKQLNNEVGYRFNAPAEIPFIDWAESFWADGKNPRQDGLSYDCTTDFGGDGLHLSALGELKAGKWLFNYYKNDTLSKYWFLKAGNTTGASSNIDLKDVKVFPNPVKSQVNVTAPFVGTFEILSNVGQIVLKGNINEQLEIDSNFIKPGIYFIRVTNIYGHQGMLKVLIQP